MSVNHAAVHASSMMISGAGGNARRALLHSCPGRCSDRPLHSQRQEAHRLVRTLTINGHPVRETGHVRNKAIYVAIGVNMQGHKEVLGLWAGQTEGAKFWLQVLTELKNRGVADVFIACVDGLKGFPESIATVFPEAQVQLCVVHQVRASLNYVSWKQRKAVAADLQPIYRASTVEEAGQRLDEFAAKWDGAYPTISQMWRRNWEHLTPFFAYPADIRKVIYTTNAVESLNMSLRKVIKTRGSFPSQEAAMKLLYLALEHIAKKWTMPVQNWKGALQRFAILLGDRVPKTELA